MFVVWITGVVFEEWHELRPRAAPELDEQEIPLAPLGGELLEPVLRRLLGRGHVERLE